MAFTDLLGFLRSKLAAGQVLTRSGRAIMGVDLSALTSAGHQLPATTNTYDLGATGTTWRRIYLGGYAVTPTIGASAAQQHALPAVTSSTLAVLGAAQTWTGVQTFSAPIAASSGTDTGVSPVTINQPSGVCRVQSGATQVVVNNSLVGAATKVFTQLLATPSNAVYVQSVAPGVGSFTITLSGDPGASHADVAWFIVN